MSIESICQKAINNAKGVDENAFRRIYVNYGRVFISVKVITDNLTQEQLEKVFETLRNDPIIGERILRILNGTISKNSMRNDGGQKVMIRIAKLRTTFVE